MPPPASPARPTRSKRESMTITRTVGKALADVMNKDNASHKLSKVALNKSDTISSSVGTRYIVGSRQPPSTLKDTHRVSRTSSDSQSRSSDTSRSTPGLVKRSPAAPSPSKPLIRSRSSMGPPLLPPPSVSKDNAASSKPLSKSRASLTFRGLSSTLQTKTTQQPLSLPKYKTKGTADQRSVESGTRKRQSDSDVEKVDSPDLSKDADSTSDSDADDDDANYVEVKRPISPLPRRAARKRFLPVVAFSLTPSTPPKKNVLQKVSDGLSSGSPRTKTPKISASPMMRLRTGASHSRPSSVASNSSQRTPPIQSTRKAASASKLKTAPSVQSSHRRSTVPETPASTNSRLTSSPSNPFHLPDTSGGSLLSPPLSPSLDDISLDSIDAGDVSTLLYTVLSPTKPTPAPSRTAVELPHSSLLPSSQGPFPPQTPVSQRSLSILTTDPRQAVLSLREYLERSGDIDHLLSQPLPSVFSPDARERLLSFGFSPESAPPLLSTVDSRPEPQTPCPVPDDHGFTSISQVLFPSFGDFSNRMRGQEEPPNPDEVTALKERLVFEADRRLEREARIEDLETQLALSRESHKQETARLSAQVMDLEHKLQEVVMKQDLETATRVEEIEAKYQAKDVEWRQQMAFTVAQIQEQDAMTQQSMLSMERRKRGIINISSAWDHVQEVALNELALLRSNRQFVAITLAGLEISMGQLRTELNC